jgi:hypothetical protein
MYFRSIFDLVNVDAINAEAILTILRSGIRNVLVKLLNLPPLI